MNLKERILSDMTDLEKFTLLVIGSEGNQPVQGRLWFEKILFLLSNVYRSIQDEADFEPYLFGPHSDVALKTLDEYQSLKVVLVDGNKIKLSDLGKDIENEVERRASDQEKELTSNFKSFLNDLSKEELLAFIYFSYPDMKKESIEYQKLIPLRKRLALKLYRKEKVSLERAAIIAGLTLEEFLDLYSKNRSVPLENI